MTNGEHHMSSFFLLKNHIISTVKKNLCRDKQKEKRKIQIKITYYPRVTHSWHFEFYPTFVSSDKHISVFYLLIWVIHAPGTKSERNERLSVESKSPIYSVAQVKKSSLTWGSRKLGSSTVLWCAGGSVMNNPSKTKYSWTQHPRKSIPQHLSRGNTGNTCGSRPGWDYLYMHYSRQQKSGKTQMSIDGIMDFKNAIYSDDGWIQTNEEMNGLRPCPAAWWILIWCWIEKLVPKDSAQHDTLLLKVRNN